MSTFCFVYVTCPDEETAQKISSHALQKRLAACTNIIPNMKSMYRWKGKIETSNETILILKTKKSAFAELKTLVTQHHPYEIPCILSWDLTQGHQPFLNWIQSEVL